MSFLQSGRNDKVYWKNIKNERYLLLSFTDLKNDEEALDIVTYAIDVLSDVPDNSVKIITDLTKVTFSIDTHLSLNTFSKKCQSKIKKSAIVGMSTSMRPFYIIYKLFTKSRAVLFKSIEEAEEFLCK